jgi:dihydroorotate dehydrogenase
MQFWERILRPILFRLPAESVHHLSMSFHAGACRLPMVRPWWRWMTGPIDPRLSVNCAGLSFRSPVGLAAGFDKQARWFESLGALGFGSIESGSITGQSQPGNPKPRLFRLPRDQAIVNRMGFNSAGADVSAEWLKRHRGRVQAFRKNCVLGINLGKTKAVPLDQAYSDYEYSLERLFGCGDYFVVNVSSPNTAGLRDLQQRELLTDLTERIASRIAELAECNSIPAPPLFLKIAPDLTESQIDEIADIVLDSPVAGLIATNTTVSREGLTSDSKAISACGDGGLSGRPLHLRSVTVVKRLRQKFQGKKIIIGVGGIFDGDDVWRMMSAGANLVQLYTGFIYGGPMTVFRIHHRLVELLDQHKLSSITDLTGQSADDI